MAMMGCALCRIKQDVAPSSQEDVLVCQRHPNRILMDWSTLEAHPDDQWMGLILNQRYELTVPLGKGGFGSVYFAVQRGHIRYPVAIKLLTRQSPEYLDLFRDEMRVISRLQSPHTVRYLDSGTHRDEFGRDIPFMVMNYIEGETLAHRIIRDGALNPKDVIAMLRQLLYSLEEAHKQGIVHRDLKPLNLMVNQKPPHPLQLVVLDFGVARILDEASREATQNRIMGTPYYLAPETLMEQKVTPATDLFAAAVITYEALCCRSPFLNEELQGIEPYLKLRKLYRKNTKPLGLPDKFSREWRLFFECALAIDPQRRFPDASSMLIALDELERIEREREQAELSKTPDDFEEEEVTTFFKRHLAGESVDEETLQSLSEYESVQVLETLNIKPPPLPHLANYSPGPPASPALPASPAPTASPAPPATPAPPVSPAPPASPAPLSESHEKITTPEFGSRQAQLRYDVQSVLQEQKHESIDKAESRITSTKPADQHAPTMQIAKPNFLEISVQKSTPPYYPKKPYSTSGAQRYSSDLPHQGKSSEGWISIMLILFQLVLMVGLGAIFAYLMIRYVLA